MEQINRQAHGALDHLYGILDAGERGYAVAAANVNNRALKMLFKTYARQRADSKAELAEQIENPRFGLRALIDLAAMIHRGRINIFAALTIGEENRERVVMKEVGEEAALKAYKKALGRPLPRPIKELLQRQFMAVEEVVEQVRLMLGVGGQQLVVRLYDSKADAARALKALQQAHFDPAAVQRIAVDRETEVYEAKPGGNLFETILSGATGGSMWGAVSGTLAGFGVLRLPGLGLERAPLATQEFAWAVVALGAIMAGAFVGAVIGAFIGWGVNDADAYIYDEGQQRGQALLKLQTAPQNARRAAQIMAQVNREVRAERRHAPA